MMELHSEIKIFNQSKTKAIQEWVNKIIKHN